MGKIKLNKTKRTGNVEKIKLSNNLDMSTIHKSEDIERKNYLVLSLNFLLLKNEIKASFS